MRRGLYTQRSPAGNNFSLTATIKERAQAGRVRRRGEGEPQRNSRAATLYRLNQFDVGAVRVSQRGFIVIGARPVP
jgi:hypothetical protein